MTKEHLQNLVDVHNILYSFSVSGQAIIPMAQVLVTLQNVIRDVSEEINIKIETPTSDTEVVQ